MSCQHPDFDSARSLDPLKVHCAAIDTRSWACEHCDQSPKQERPTREALLGLRRVYRSGAGLVGELRRCLANTPILTARAPSILSKFTCAAIDTR